VQLAGLTERHAKATKLIASLHLAVKQLNLEKTDSQSMVSALYDALSQSQTEMERQLHIGELQKSMAAERALEEQEAAQEKETQERGGDALGAMGAMGEISGANTTGYTSPKARVGSRMNSPDNPKSPPNNPGLGKMLIRPLTPEATGIQISYGLPPSSLDKNQGNRASSPQKERQRARSPSPERLTVDIMDTDILGNT